MEKYKSNYTNNYLKNSEQGKSYDKKINNRFELLIWDLEKYFLEKVIKEKFGDERNFEYMDFACGTGRIIAYCKNELGVKNAWGVDTSETMLREARKKTQVQFLHVNIAENANALVDKKFDIITAFRLFLNLEKENRPILLEALKKYLKDDGILVFNNHINRYSLIGFQFWIRRILGDKKVINTATKKEFRNLLTDAGFEVIKIYEFTFLPGRKSAILLPWKILKNAEIFLAKIPIIRSFALSQIYVCRKRI